MFTVRAVPELVKVISEPTMRHIVFDAAAEVPMVTPVQLPVISGAR